MIKKVLHILLASLVLISSSGLITHLHYCQNELKEYSFFVETDQCPKEMPKTPPCPMHAKGMDHDMPGKKDCCEDETHYVKISVEQEAFSLLSDISVDLLSPSIGVGNDPLTKNFEKGIDYYLNYKPPLIFCDVQVRLQIFRC